MATYDITTYTELEFDITRGAYISGVLLDSTHLVVAYSGYAYDGYIAVININTSTWALTLGDVSEHDSVQGDYNSLALQSSTSVVLGYAGAQLDGYIKKFTFDGSYNITQERVLEHDTTSNKFNSLVIPRGGFWDGFEYIMAYAGSGDDGYIQKFFDGGGTSIIQSTYLEHDTAYAGYNSMIMFINPYGESTYAGSVQVLSYTDSSGYGVLKVFSWSDSYAAVTEEDKLTHSTGSCSYGSVTKIDDTHIALAQNIDDELVVKTFSVSESGFTITQIDSAVIESTDCSDLDLRLGGDGTLLLAWTRVTTGSTEAVASIISFDEDYETITEENQEVIDTAGVGYTTLAQIDDTHWAYFYSGLWNDGYVLVIELELPSTSAIKTINTLIKASVKVVNGLALASVKSMNALE